MKRLVYGAFVIVSLLTAADSSAQDQKTKAKDGKVKTKEGDSKVKTEDDKTKIKEGDNKIKIDGNEMKVKEGENKLKIEGAVNMLYTPSYSSEFIIGNRAYTQNILELWKDYDDNAFQRHAGYFSDTVTVILSDGTTIKGNDSVFAAVSTYRNSISNVKTTVEAWVPLKSTDRNEDWVAIWGTETFTDSQGKTSTNAVHEIWGFNKDGKVSYMRQYQAKVPQ